MELSIVRRRCVWTRDLVTRLARARDYVHDLKSVLAQHAANPAPSAWILDLYVRPFMHDLLRARLMLITAPRWTELGHGNLDENDVMAALLLAVWRLADAGALVPISMLDFLQLFGAIGPFTRFTAHTLATRLHDQYMLLPRLINGERDLCLLLQPSAPPVAGTLRLSITCLDL